MINYSDEKIAHIALNMIPQIGPKRFLTLIKTFGSARKALKASYKELNSIYGIGEDTAAKMRAFCDEPKTIEKEIAAIDEQQVRVVLLDEHEYPELLSHISAPPPVLYLKGCSLPRHAGCAALVGTRRPTPTGREIARRITHELVHQSIVTVSGCARGIDTEVHAATLVSGGFTIAVMGNGLSVAYPPENRKLMENIARSGMLISEFPMSAGPDRTHFPRRNRIISGMSTGTVVIEAGLRSGALITAMYALEEGRDVCAVPGHPFHIASQGNNWLLRQGARLATTGAEIIEEMFPHAARARTNIYTDRADDAVLSEMERKIIDYIGRDHAHIDHLIEMTGVQVGMLMRLLLDLQMKGLIEELPGKYYMCCMKGCLH